MSKTLKYMEEINERCIQTGKMRAVIDSHRLRTFIEYTNLLLKLIVDIDNDPACNELPGAILTRVGEVVDDARSS